MSSCRTVGFIMPNLTKSAENPSEIVNRFQQLATKFDALDPSKKSTSLLFSSGFTLNDPANTGDDSFLKLHIYNRKKVNSVSYLIKTFRILQNEKCRNITLVSGDNYGALLICIILRILLRLDVKIQISIHGNPFSSKESGVETFARTLAFRLLVPRATSVRLVSTHLAKSLGRYFSKDAEVIVSPIPVRVPEEFKKNEDDLSIGFVGRLHYERGVRLFCEILERLDQLGQEHSFLVIGDGPERSLIEDFKNKYPHYPLELLGSLSRSEVSKRFESISILVNCAPSEGYGLAMREALASGSSVIAFANEGTRELKESFPEMVHLFNEVEEACNLIQELSGKSPDLDLVKAYRIKQQELNDFGSDLLVKSWF